ncbi:MAG TPA: SIS domain-containing protein [Clostridiaceae bacterium]|nr:SIS domain-containing protein [Clostridiaceae bacterium]
MSLMWQEITQQPEVIENCLSLNRKTIDAIVARLENKAVSNVIIAARGTSDHAGIYGKYIIEIKKGIPVSLAAPSVFTIYDKNVDMSDSLVIAISQSGRAADALEVIRSARKQGAPTVAITNFEDSPLATEAEFHLFCGAGEEKSVAATKTFMAQIYLLAQLVAAWSRDESFKNELAGVPSLLSKTLESAEQIKNIVRIYRFMNECFVLARGTNYAIALEASLKIQETCYVRARGYATSDFHHGPFAMVGENMPVIVYAPKGESLKDNREMLEKLRNAGADILVVSNDPETLAMGDRSIEIADNVSDFVSPFINAMVAQIFACNLSALKGLNPDAPRGLSKVTYTR